jgi:hypothetical protein
MVWTFRAKCRSRMKTVRSGFDSHSLSVINLVTRCATHAPVSATGRLSGRKASKMVLDVAGRDLVGDAK